MTKRERDLVEALIESLPKCDVCKAVPATRAYARGGTRFCDACAKKAARPRDPVPVAPEYPRAKPLRELLDYMGSTVATP